MIKIRLKETTMGTLVCPVCGNTFQDSKLGRRERDLCDNSCTEFCLSNLQLISGHFMMDLTSGRCFEIVDARVKWKGEDPQRQFRDMVIGLKDITSDAVVEKLRRKLPDLRTHLLKLLSSQTDLNLRYFWVSAAVLRDSRRFRRISNPNDLNLDRL